jgi:hypothetical protein
MMTKEEETEFRLGPFTLGDLIALGGVVFMSGALWWRVAALEREDIRHETEYDRMVNRVQSLEQFIPSNYVRRDEYREDIRELKEILYQISTDMKSKVDKP